MQFAWSVQWLFLGGVSVGCWGWCGCVSVVWVLVRWWRGFRIFGLSDTVGGVVLVGSLVVSLVGVFVGVKWCG